MSTISIAERSGPTWSGPTDKGEDGEGLEEESYQYIVSNELYPPRQRHSPGRRYQKKAPQMTYVKNLYLVNPPLLPSSSSAWSVLRRVQKTRF